MNSLRVSRLLLCLDHLGKKHALTSVGNALPQWLSSVCRASVEGQTKTLNSVQRLMKWFHMLAEGIGWLLVKNAVFRDRFVLNQYVNLLFTAEP